MKLTDQQLFLVASLVPSAEEICDRVKTMTEEHVPESEALEFGFKVRWAVLGVLGELRGQELSEESFLAAVDEAVLAAVDEAEDETSA
ncbi:MAG: hypothetical protein M3P49_08865 [Actinomycetota bacterium]|nr:hypothetical protein [Actinomycetota bacterium]